MPEKLPVAVLGATGSVGQRFIQLLDTHPWFEVVALTGSERRLAQKFGESCHWVLPEPMPEWAAGMKLLNSSPDSVRVPLVFSALPSQEASQIEGEFARFGTVVCTNAGAFRKEKDVPILLPEVNPDHIGLVEEQRRNRNWKGFIVTNPNCTSTGMTVALKALQSAFGLCRVFAVSLQALSGAGYPGVASLDITDNVVPFISGEEDKVEWEPRKMLGRLEEGEVQLADFTVSAHCNRVAVSDGHLVCLSVELRQKAEIAEIETALADYSAPEVSRHLPSAPRPVIRLRSEADRPQPRLDRMTGRGMTTVVGRIRTDSLLDCRLAVLSHNTIRGAAGGSIYNAELLFQQGLIAS